MGLLVDAQCYEKKNMSLHMIGSLPKDQQLKLKNLIPAIQAHWAFACRECSEEKPERGG